MESNMSVSSTYEYILRKTITDSMKSILIYVPIYTSGDGFCSIHSVLLAYLAKGYELLYDNSGQKMFRIKEMRNFLLSYIRERYDEYGVEKEDLVRQLKDDTTTSIKNHLIFKVLSDILEVNIHIHYLGIVTSVYADNMKNDIHILGSGVHYEAYLDEKSLRQRPSEMPKDFRNWWFVMVNESDNLSDDTKEKLRGSLILY